MQPQGQDQRFQQAPPPNDTSVHEAEHEGARIINPSPPIDPRTGQPMENPLRDARNGELVDGYMPIIDPNNPTGSLVNNPAQTFPGNNVFQHPPAQPDAAKPAVASAPPPPPPPPGGPNGPIPPGPPKNPDDYRESPTLPPGGPNGPIPPGPPKTLMITENPPLFRKCQIKNLVIYSIKLLPQMLLVGRMENLRHLLLDIKVS